MTRTTNSNEVNKELENRMREQHLSCYPKLFDGIDETKFRKGLNIEKCKQFIFWSNIGFTNQILDKIRNSENSYMDCDSIMSELDEYFEELRKIFYA